MSGASRDEGARASAARIAGREIDLLILDLDGVLTKTARLHAAAWKEVFDEVLARHKPGSVPFDAADEYRELVDGKPRLDGVAAFLNARGIELPFGEAGEAPGLETVWAIGNRKNERFRALIEQGGIDVFEDAVNLVRAARIHEIKTAVISASKNCRPILTAADLTSLFDAICDGTDAETQGLKGKPAPDVFLTVARALGVAPENAAIIEDAQAGVEAGQAGGFGLVIGLDRTGDGSALRAHGADVAFADLKDVLAVPSLPDDLPVYAHTHMEEIEASVAGKGVAVFLDYDGTLTPIVSRPELAVLSAEMRECLHRLAQLTTVCIISGRSMEDVRALVWLGRSHLCRRAWV